VYSSDNEKFLENCYERPANADNQSQGSSDNVPMQENFSSGK